MLPLAIGAVGVVYGDIGTSPLYTLRTAFTGSYGLSLTPAARNCAIVNFMCPCPIRLGWSFANIDATQIELAARDFEQPAKRANCIDVGAGL